MVGGRGWGFGMAWGGECCCRPAAAARRCAWLNTRPTLSALPFWLPTVPAALAARPLCASTWAMMASRCVDPGGVWMDVGGWVGGMLCKHLGDRRRQSAWLGVPWIAQIDGMSRASLPTAALPG